MGGSMDNKWAVVTGASSGLGAKFAEKLAEKGYNLVIVARRRDRLQALQKVLRKKYHVECEPMVADLSKKASCLVLFDLIKNLDVEVFINNAGFGDCGRFAETDLDKELEMIDVNVRAVHILTKLMVLKFSEKKRGYILNVASSAGLLPAGPFMATYYATKSYVTSLTRAVAAELERRGSNVYVGCLCSGPVDTEFNSVANVRFALKGISSEKCVKYAISRMFRRDIIIIPDFKIRTAMTFSRYIPQDIVIMTTGNQQKKKFEKKKER